MTTTKEISEMPIEIHLERSPHYTSRLNNKPQHVQLKGRVKEYLNEVQVRRLRREIEKQNIETGNMNGLQASLTESEEWVDHDYEGVMGWSGHKEWFYKLEIKVLENNKPKMIRSEYRQDKAYLLLDL